MRSGSRGTIAALVAATSLVAVIGPAQAVRHPTPTRGQVLAAEHAALTKAQAVSVIEARLVVAKATLQTAEDQAGAAAEAYDGAEWRLSIARQQTAAARAAEAAALAQVQTQRSAVAQLVTQSYFDGTPLNDITAIVGGDGPAAVMNRLDVVHSAGDSMQARFERYTATRALAEVAAAKAARAEADQQKLAARAATLRDQAAAAATTALHAASDIATQRRHLIQQLATAQHISLMLATRRQKALELIAQQKAAAAAAAQAKADAQNQANQAGTTQQELQSLGPEGGWDLPGLSAPRGTVAGAQKAIAFARAHLGDPYVWAAAGPNAWDCSGLTMVAWAQSGVSFPHFAAAQYQLTVHETVGQLRPGDLVFWGTSPDTIHHVALYIGNNQIIQAPHTGDVVKISGMYDWEAPEFFGRP
jgi:cell wall-associated NlpC family hydrolase